MSENAAKILDIERTQSLVIPERRVFRVALKGMLTNRDFFVVPAASSLKELYVH